MTIKKKVRSKIELDLTGPQGNAFVVLGTVQRLMKTLKFHEAQIKTVKAEMMSGDYEHLIATAEKHFGKYIDFYR
jgi:hypothetical protein